MNNLEKRLQEAKQYINFCIKEGYGNFEDLDIAAMTDEEIIKLAKDSADRADAYYESLKENDDYV